MKINCKKTFLWSGTALLFVLSSGCGKSAPDPQQQAVGPNATETNNRIQSIQNDASLSPADKQKAIEIIKSREVRAPAAP